MIYALAIVALFLGFIAITIAIHGHDDVIYMDELEDELKRGVDEINNS